MYVPVPRSNPHQHSAQNCARNRREAPKFPAQLLSAPSRPALKEPHTSDAVGSGSGQLHPPRAALRAAELAAVTPLTGGRVHEHAVGRQKPRGARGIERSPAGTRGTTPPSPPANFTATLQTRNKKLMARA